MKKIKNLLFSEKGMRMVNVLFSLCIFYCLKAKNRLKGYVSFYEGTRKPA